MAPRVWFGSNRRFSSFRKARIMKISSTNVPRMIPLHKIRTAKPAHEARTKLNIKMTTRMGSKISAMLKR